MFVMLPLGDLFPGGFLDRCWVRNRFTFESDPPHCLTVFFQNHLPRLGHYAENATYTEGQVVEDRLVDKERIFGLTYVLAGRAALRNGITGEESTVTAGDLLCFNDISPEQIQIRPEPGYLEAGLCLDLHLGRQLRDEGLWPGPWTAATVGDSVPLVKAIDDLYTQLGNQRRGYRSLHWRLLRICDLAQELAEASGADAGFSARACRILSEHAEPGFTVADAAALLGLSLSRFRRQFTAEMGIAPGLWQTRQRMQRAADLLVELPVHRVASELGYSDPAVFSRQFRQAMGIPPSAVRRRVGRSRH